MTMTNKIKVPKTVTKTLYIYIGVDGYNFNDISVADYSRVGFSSEMESVLLKTQEVTFDLSDAESIDDSAIKGEIVKQLKEQQKEIKAETHMKIKDLQDKIDNLLAIEFKPEEVPEKTHDPERMHPKANTISG